MNPPPNFDSGFLHKVFDQQKLSSGNVVFDFQYCQKLSKSKIRKLELKDLRKLKKYFLLIISIVGNLAQQEVRHDSFQIKAN